MCSEEGIVDAKLIELNEEVIVRDAVEAWNIRPTEDDSRNSERHQHVHRQRYVIVGSAVIASPHSTVALRAEEEGSGQDERPLLAPVSLVKSLPRCSLLECAICIVDPPVLDK